MSSVRRTRAVNRVASTVIPAILLGCIGFATYVVSKRICVDWFLNTRGQTTTAVVLLVFHFVVLAIELAAYARLVVTILFDPGLLPRGEKYSESTKEGRQLSGTGPDGNDLEGRRYDDIEAGHSRDVDPNSPGLERFYSKDVFICENDGLPRWCSSCKNWKPDRTHHSSDINRCVRKMDHFCPWVGGIISETSFKFFVQFVFYNTLYCIICLVASALCLHDQQATHHNDGVTIAIIAMAAFFGLFTFGMTTVSLQYIILNLTNVEIIRQKSMVHQLAIRVPQHTEPTPYVHIVTYPLPEPGNEGPASGPLVGHDDPLSARDQLATRKFAVVRTQLGENPWDLGPYDNWKSVMGTNILDWLLPINMSPCVYEENNESFYRMGSLRFEASMLQFSISSS